jgi:hypothetical protein
MLAGRRQQRDALGLDEREMVHLSESGRAVAPNPLLPALH